ncbi:MAG TPA: hypothetical protein VEV43_11175 [Actinomycetota bacterium]|nr:hypothetical protein [Actinomycetota bacterium]
MDDELRRILGTRFANEVLAVLVGCVRDSYRFRQSVYSEQGGDDSTTFGIGVSRGALNLIERALDDRDDVQAHRPQGSFLIAAENNIQVRCWKIGLTEKDDVESIRWEGSEAKKAPGRDNDRQLRLELGDDVPPEPGHEKHLPNLVIGHLGNSIDGCCRIVLGTPKDREGWHFHRDIWRIADEDIVRSTVDFGPEPIWTGDEPIGEGLQLPEQDDEDPEVKLRGDEENEPDIALRHDDDGSGSAHPGSA